jgi:6-phosphogluconolactonase
MHAYVLIFCTYFCAIVLAEQRTLYVGGYDTHITILDLDTNTGSIKYRHKIPTLANPTWISLDPSRKYLYAGSEVDEYDGKKTGAIVSFIIDKNSKNLIHNNRVASHGGSPCFLDVSRDGKHLLVANYMGPTFSVFKIQDGKIGNLTFTQVNKGHGPNPSRQEMAHPHQFVFDLSNKHAFVSDLGNDLVYQFVWDGVAGIVKPNPVKAQLPQKPGSGPRHLTFHPSQKFAYLVHELDNSLTIFDYNAETGVLTQKDIINTVPKDADAKHTYVAEIFTSPDGQFLYVSNRGEKDTRGSNTIAIYKIANDGKLTLVEYTSTYGVFPRYFSLDERGETIVVVNQLSDNLVVYKRSVSEGKLVKIGSYEGLKAPTAVVIY